MSLYLSDYGEYLVRGFSWFVLAYWVFVWISIWRSAGKYKGSSGWATTARVIVVIGMLATIGRLTSNFADPYNANALRENQTLINNSLPTMVDGSTRLDSVELTPSEFFYNYTIMNSLVAEYDVNLFELQMRVMLENSACAESEIRSDFEAGIQYVYKYRDSVGDTISNIVISLADCE